MVSSASLSIGGCSDGAPKGNDAPPVATIEQAFSTSGVTRVIPLKLIIGTTTPPPANYVSYASVLHEIDRLNEAFAPAEIQFTLSSMGTYHLPTVATWEYKGTNPVKTWPEVRSEFAAIWPDVSALNSVFCTDPNNDMTCAEYRLGAWINALSVLRGKREEIVVWAWPGNGFGAEPRSGKMIKVPISTSLDGVNRLTPNATVHEMGHYFGLQHTFKGDLSDSFCGPYGGGGGIQDPLATYDPETGQQTPPEFFMI